MGFSRLQSMQKCKTLLLTLLLKINESVFLPINMKDTGHFRENILKIEK